jgi:D-3-phosphoglycerate dehydrogenase
MFKIRTLNDISDRGLAQLPRNLYVVSSDEARPDAYLVRSHKMHDMDFHPSLLAVARAGAGVNNIPVDRLSSLGIPVFNAPGANANAVKELVLAGLLMSSRNLIPAVQFVRELKGTDEEISRAVESGKKKFLGSELPRRTLGVIGLGAVGVRVANSALALGMRVIGFDPQITVQRAWELSAGVQKASSIDDLFARSEMVTVHVPLIEDTKSLVNRKRIASMPDHSILLNFSRNEIVDASAVSDALDAGKLRAYVTDFPSARLKERPDVISLPHLGASTAEAEENSAVMVIENLKEFLEHGNVSHSVNFPEAVLVRTRDHRIAIPHRNVPNMVAQILTSLADENINIADLLNRSRGEISYTIVDIDSPASPETLKRIRNIDGILSARVLPIIEPQR